MDPKSNVVKSKSSNSAISKKSEGSRRQYDKKTRSNANFPCHGLKKRGVYVEKRSTKTNLVNNGKDCVTQKPPPRPRPGQKRFLASVLTILSKSTTGTQYPETDEDTKERKFREKYKNKRTLKQRNANDEDGVDDSKDIKDKFKSRVLNKKFVREDKKKMVVLQSKKDIAQTPSNYSEWSYKDASQNSNVSNLMIYEDSNNNGTINIADELKNAVLEGRNLKVKKLRYLEDEPKTLVSDGAKGQKNLYNFFVDFLETTISVYNVKADYDATVPSNTSKTNLQINESVANKLNIGKAKNTVAFDDETVTPQNLHYVLNDMDYESDFASTATKTTVIEPFKRERSVKTAKVRKVKADSFIYPYNAKSMLEKSKSVETKRKTKFRNKNDLINVLRQELEVDANVLEEPRSIFQALRVMARNKKKITFDSSIDYKTFTDECVLKRRKVISTRKMKKTNKEPVIKNVKPIRPMFNNAFYARNHRKSYADLNKRDSSESDSDESYHSLEVYGFDYETKTPKKPYAYRAEDLTFTYHSSPCNSDLDFDVNDAILYPTSASSSIRKFSNIDMY